MALEPKFIRPPDIPERFYVDMRKNYSAFWQALAEPKNINDLLEIMAYCRENRIPLVPIGGGTGLVGGHVFPDERGGIALSMRHFDDLEIIGNSAFVGAGVVLDELHIACEKTRNLQFPMHLASSGSAQIGGLISTNAGGVHVVRYGSMGAQVEGLDAILADGTVIKGAKTLKKDNTGYQLDKWLIGAEGTLGVITRARLRLQPKDLHKTLVFMEIASPAQALEIFYALEGLLVNAFELISGVGLKFREQAGFSPTPLNPPWLVLIEFAHEIEEFAEILQGYGQVIIAKNSREYRDLWNIRETIPAANRFIGAIASHDISLPLEMIPPFIDEMIEIMNNHGVVVNCFGHLGDGNLHFNLFPQSNRKAVDYDSRQLSHMVYENLVRLGGSISAEHGIGRAKAKMLQDYGYNEKLKAMKKFKDAIDPHNFLNPGVIFSD